MPCRAVEFVEPRKCARPARCQRWHPLLPPARLSHALSPPPPRTTQV
jgi:hypothetical protein